MDKFELTPAEITEFKANLTLGFGFTKSCQHILKSVKDVSTYYRNNTEFQEICKKGIKNHINGVLNMGQKAMSEMDFDEFLKHNGYLTRFVIKLTLWEEFSTSKKLTEDDFYKAIFIYRYPEEVATACGFTLGEMYDFIKQYEKLSIYVENIGFV